MPTKIKNNLTGREYNEHGIQILVINPHVLNVDSEQEYLCIRDGREIILTENYLQKQVRITKLKTRYREGKYPGGDLAGSWFGRWEVLKYVGRNKAREPVWLCKCACGSLALVPDTSLKTGKSKSCGCFKSLKRRFPDITLIGSKCYLGDVSLNTFTSQNKTDLTGHEYSEFGTTSIQVVGFHGVNVSGENEYLCLKDNKIPVILTEKWLTGLKRTHTINKPHKWGKYPKQDLVGMRFGYWMVTKFLGRDKGRHAIWLCECRCGNQSPILDVNLKNGASQSCGCFKKLHAWCPSARAA